MTNERETGSTLFDESALGFVLEAFNKEVDSDGFVIGQDGERMTARDGDPIRYDEIGGFVKGPNGEPLIIRDSYPNIIEWVKETYKNDNDESL